MKWERKLSSSSHIREACIHLFIQPGFPSSRDECEQRLKTSLQVQKKECSFARILESGPSTPFGFSLH